MNIEIINALFNYLKTLYELNQKLIKLCGIDIIVRLEDGQTEIIDIIQNVPRLVPYSKDKANNKLYLDDNDGLLEFKNELAYLKSDYLKILNDHYDTLEKVKLIRNKYEHKIHKIKFTSANSGSSDYFGFLFSIGNEDIRLQSAELISLVKDLNILFSKIIDNIKQFANDEEKSNHPYYMRIFRFDFSNFNKIYDSEIIRIIGESMYDF